ncbi:L-threonine O-3-phosphate decarboxylase [Anoxybacillus vitaminiphilus]|uniref:threonine-phosphate decarboxylase n=1 Tax=Paranoxybacillus vitaminiphilus TaxID=581036 RepID=A0A327YMQ3_9BACL|nr:threonine-phosphate decarboxylase CobD [Anoxybacillus vitaminiphilus]RAK22213.1 L-threonine O-3-phosphate decarboxylase [Anoxybacillus vitaminiphilus]
MNLPSHGANPHLLYKSLRLEQPERSVDFSVNTNPYQLQLEQIPSQEEFYQWMLEYPDPDSSELTNHLAKIEKVSKEQILIGNGASQCIYLLAQLFSGKRAGMIEPTFSEYRAACIANGCKVSAIYTTEECGWKCDLHEIENDLKDIDILFLCQPNNPTGTALSQEELYHVLQIAENAGTYVIIDEAFYHFWLDGFSAVQWLQQFPHVIVLRSLTKMYHLAGVRVGYVVADEHIIQQLKAIQPPWSVNRVAQQFSLRLLQMTSFVEKTKQKIAEERERVTKILQNAGYYVSPSVVNFYLLRKPGQQTEQLMHDMLKAGFVPRHTYNFYGLEGKYLRLAVRTKDENERLLHFLVRWKQ